MKPFSVVNLRMSEDQKRLYEQAAKEMNLKTSVWMRLILDEAAKPKETK